MPVKPFGALTPSQQRMVAAGKIGRLCDLVGKGEPAPIAVEVIGLGTPLIGYPEALRSVLIVKHYYSEDLLTIPLSQISRLDQRDWPISDHRHPEWEDPGRIVRAKR